MDCTPKHWYNDLMGALRIKIKLLIFKYDFNQAYHLLRKVVMKNQSIEDKNVCSSDKHICINMIIL